MIRIRHIRSYLALLLLGGCGQPVPKAESTPQETPPPEPPPLIVEVVPPEPEPFRLYAPTRQHCLDGSRVTNIFMHAGNGNPESGLFGFQRAASDGRPRLHEGIDIAPLARDKRRRPLDEVTAAATGTVAYVNRRAGDSSYGIYIVILHQAPHLGPVYTLYAHLASIAPDIKPGKTVVAGNLLGRIGNTPGFPLSRAHLHFECGLINNNRFARWYHDRYLKRHPPKKNRPRPADHGIFHGSNLTGLNPNDLFRIRAEDARVPLLPYLRELPIAFTLLCKTNRIPDYFRRYPALWSGEPFRPGTIRLSVSQEGIVLRGTNEPESNEATTLPKILAVNTTLPGLLGRRYVRPDGARWKLTPSGEEWLDAFLY